MKKWSFCISVFLMAVTFGFASTELSQDESIKIGNLENGLSYYVKQNPFPKGRISLQLVVKAGSIHEEEYQRGLAHFLEHMVFRGSQNFQDWEVIEYLESIGAKLGPDANAYTTQEYTVYQLDIPAEKGDIVEKGFQILADFAGKATLDDALIDLEREVVMDEYNRNLRSAQGRIMEKLFTLIFGDSLYARRHPIGKEEIIRGCDPSAIKDFYYKWYRPDRMAVMVVGDVDESLMEGYVKKYFSSLENRGEAPTEPDKTITKGEDREVVLIEESENVGYQGGILSLREKAKKDLLNEEEIKNEICQSIFTTTVNQRLMNLSKGHPAPFLGSAVIRFDLTLDHEIDYFVYMGFEDRLVDGLKALVSEMKMVKAFGPTEEELKRVVSMEIEGITSARANIERKEHSAFIASCINHFLKDQMIPKDLEYFDVREECLKTLSIEDIVQWASKNIDIAKHDLVFIGPSALPIDKKVLEGAFDDLLKGEIAFEKKKDSIDTFSVKKGENEEKRYAVEQNMVHPFKTYTLANGLKVIAHKSDLEKDRIACKLIAKGGATLFEDSHHSSYGYASQYLLHSGLGNMDGIALEEFLSGLQIGCQVSLEMNQRGGSFSARSERFSDIMKLIRALFTEKRFDENAWNSILAQAKEIEKTIDNNPQQYFFTKEFGALFSFHPFFLQAKTSEASRELAEEILNRSFGDPSEFTLVIVGDFDEKIVEKEILEYLNFTMPILEKMDRKEIPLGTFPKESLERITYLGKDTHCYNVLAFGGAFTFVDKKSSELTVSAFSNAFNFRLLERLRKDMGETYGTFSMVFFPFAPNVEEFVFLVFFTCDYPMIDKLISATEEEFDRFIKEGVSQKEVDSAKEVLVQNYKKSVQYDHFLLDSHIKATLSDGSYEDAIDFERALEAQVTKEKIDLLAKTLLENRPLVKLRLLPESMKEGVKK